MAEDNKFLTVYEIQNILGIGRGKAYKLVNEKDFPKVIIGDTIRVPYNEFNKYIKHHLYGKINL